MELLEIARFSRSSLVHSTQKKEPREATAQQLPEVHPGGGFSHLVGCVDAREVLEREQDVEPVSHPNLGT